jgi:hypothetical protein
VTYLLPLDSPFPSSFDQDIKHEVQVAMYEAYTHGEIVRYMPHGFLALGRVHERRKDHMWTNSLMDNYV